MRILVTGGAGYIGGHTALALAQRGHDVIIVDNFSNSSPVAVARISALSGRPMTLFEVDLRDRGALAKVFAEQKIDAVIHFAALKAVGESCEKPLSYFDNNITGTLNLLQVMRDHQVTQLVFSSSATVYGTPEHVPVAETAKLGVTNPYGRTKLVCEQLIEDLAASDKQFRFVNLRYFNPVGAHKSGQIGEDPRDIPNNLMPYICQVAVGRRDTLQVFGNDYPTVDGTGVRDYIHVLDLADAHVAALDYLANLQPSRTINLGTGRGVSVLELVKTFEKMSGRSVAYQIVGRRAGDVAEVYADPTLAAQLLGWRAKYSVEDMCADAWRWQQANPNGYPTDGKAAA